MKSLRELYSVGRGPSSSHTIGPWRACRLFRSEHPDADRYEVTLFGSLALTGRGHLIDLIRIFEKENPELPMRVDHGRMMLGDEDKGYNPGYSFHGRMLALAQVEGMMAVVQDEINN